MSGNRPSRQLQRVRTRSHRKLKLVLLALGVMSVLIGLGTVFFALIHDKGPMVLVGAAYGVLGAGLLAVRQALEVMRETKRRHRADRHQRRRESSAVRGGDVPVRNGGA